MVLQCVNASEPDTRTTAIPPVPGAVDMAVMVDIKYVLTLVRQLTEVRNARVDFFAVL